MTERARDDPRDAGLDLYLEELEERLQETVRSHGGIVAAVSRDALSAGGKRLRPLLVFFSAPAGRAPSVAAGVAVELVHMATLVHDDLIDGAEFRRGRASAWSAYGPDAARATGDYLFARAFAELAATGDAHAVALLADAALCLARGEAMQRRQAHDPDTTVEALPRALQPEDREALRGRLPARRGRAAGGISARSGSRSGSRSRSPTTSSTARARRSRPGRSPASTSARERRRCR